METRHDFFFPELEIIQLESILVVNWYIRVTECKGKDDVAHAMFGW